MNGIQYTVGATPAGALRKGDMAIAIDTADYGASFYAGITPPSGGYTIYQDKPTGGPSIYTVANDSSLIVMTNNQVAGSLAAPGPYTTAEQCLEYYTTQNDKLCVNRDYEPILATGLVMLVDAGYTPSYPRTGTTWFGLIENRNIDLTGTAPVYISTNGGGFTMTSASSPSLNPSLTLSDFTVEFVVNFSSLSNNGILGYSGQWLRITSATTWTFRGVAGASWSGTFGSLLTSTNYYFSFVRQGSDFFVYINGTLQATSLGLDGNSFPVTNINDGGNKIKGDLFILRVYNRAMPAPEILQNFNAQKSRFGL